MKLGGMHYFHELEPEKFLYLKSVFAIKNCRIEDSSYDNTQTFRGEFEGFGIYSKSFPKGKYTL